MLSVIAANEPSGAATYLYAGVDTSVPLLSRRASMVEACHADPNSLCPIIRLILRVLWTLLFVPWWWLLGFGR